MPNQRGSLPLIVLIFIAIMIILLALAGYRVYSSKLKPPLTLTSPPKVELKEEYSNPFDSKREYSNPFEQSTNPFDNLQ